MPNEDSRLQDDFKNPDGSKLLDTPNQYTIVTFPEQAKETQYGKKFVVELQGDNGKCSWALDPAQFNRVFKHTDKNGSVTWAAKQGDFVSITLNTPKSGDFAYYTADPVTVGGSDPAPAPAPAAPTNAQPTKSEGGKSDAEYWDGTVKERNLRISYSGNLNAIISSGKVDPFNDNELEQAKSLAEDLVLHCREKGREMEKTYPNM